MTKQHVSVGIDVGVKQNFVAFREGDDLPISTYPNDPTGHRDLCRRLSRLGSPIRACVEATGIYSLDLALALHRTDGIQVMVANPRAVRNFAKAMMTRGKDDPLDARVLFEFVERMPFAPWVPPSPAAMKLRTMTRRLSGLTKSLAAEKNRLHASRHNREYRDSIEESILKHVSQLDEHIESLSKMAVEHIRSDPSLGSRYDLLLSVKGIGLASAIRLLGELAVLPADMDKRQWVAYAGLDPSRHKSGESVDKPPRISKAGNRYIRKSLYMPALVAIRHEAYVKAYYDHLRARGKKPMQAIVAVMRKLLHAIHGMFATDTAFNGALFFRRTPPVDPEQSPDRDEPSPERA